MGAEAKGERAGGGNWAVTTQMVAVPAARIVEDLRRHGSTRTEDIAELKLKALPAEGKLDRHDAAFTVKPFLFVTVEWVERWIFTLVKGTAVAPLRVDVSYEKIEGTSHIKHLCGSIAVKALDATRSEVTLYEEADASQRSADDTLKGLKETVKALAKLAGD
jgi:hypothetical protein